MSEKSQLRLLFAEDNKFNQKIGIAMLNKLGFSQIDIAVNGQEVLEKLVHTQYALILMDCEMPMLDGYAPTAKIRQQEQANHQQRIPIIAITGHSSPESRAVCLQAGMDDHLSKPVKLVELHAILRRWYKIPL